MVLCGTIVWCPLRGTQTVLCCHVYTKSCSLCYTEKNKKWEEVEALCDVSKVNTTEVRSNSKDMSKTVLGPIEGADVGSVADIDFNIAENVPSTVMFCEKAGLGVLAYATKKYGLVKSGTRTTHFVPLNCQCQH